MLVKIKPIVKQKKKYIFNYTKYNKKELSFSGIYTITNIINNKIYVGSALNFYDRFRLHIADLLNNKHHNSYLQNSVNKYGIENFDFEILEECDYTIIKSLEKYWITILDSCNSNFGYNINSNTESRLGAVLSQETKNKISNSLIGKNLTKEALINITKGIRKSIGKSVIQLDLNNNFIKEWGCITDVTKELGILETNITSNAKNKSKTCKGYRFVYKEDYNNNKNFSIKVGKFRNIVLQYDMNMNFIKEFENSSIAAKEIKGNNNNINSVCKGCGKNKSYKGFIWKYKMEN